METVKISVLNDSIYHLLSTLNKSILVALSHRSVIQHASI